MNRRNRAKSSSLFLLELILAILFFSIASAVCVQIFVKSHLMSAEAQALNLAVSECSGAAEVIAASDSEGDALDTLTSLYPLAFRAEQPSDSDATAEADKATAEVGNVNDTAIDGSNTEGDFIVFYDDTLQPCDKKTAVYQMIITLNKEDSMLLGQIHMKRMEQQNTATGAGHATSDVIYQLDVQHHLKGGTGQ